MPNIVNRLVCKELEEEFSGAEGMVFVSFGGLSVEESSEIRDELASKGIKFRMVRNSLARRVLDGQGREFPAEAFTGNTAVAYGEPEQAILAAKVLSGPKLKKAGRVKLKAGVLEGRVLEAHDAVALADIPDRPTLQAQILGAISGPARGLVQVLNGLPAGLARVLQAHSDSPVGSEPEGSGEGEG